ncbi:hypothetical protein O0I10_005761 [Lichtheimia ornata]|uniref:SEC7 domain-containing protein n=1 Tax=Lichtheimia ornata TaxID=688661 RepID=A0AAD7V3W2_9FUNG|nr:uncharacterized protein O0I10_005761 [Lichtheimia ornata]KAJ8658409.1 hypothetical protein O0I10_005761 [Lichtheimia ornata]
MKAHPEEAAHYDSDDFETADEWSVSSNDDDQDKQPSNGVVDNVPVINALKEWRQCKKRGPPSFSNASLQAFKTFFKSKEHEAKQTADALWRHDYHPSMGVVAFLAKANPFHRMVLRCYFEKFEFTDQRLDTAFRQMCSKLHLVARPSELDRIMYAFSNRYWACNLHELYGNADIVYIVTCSLAQLSIPDMVAPLSSYCRETMAQVKPMESGAQISILACGSIESWHARMKSRLEELYLSVKHSPIIFAGPDDPNALGNTISARRGKCMDEKNTLEMRSLGPYDFNKGSGLQKRLSTSWTSIRRKDMHREKNGPTKQGPLACKKNDDDEGWKPCWVILDRGSLVIYIHSVHPQQSRRVLNNHHLSETGDYLHEKGNLSSNPYLHSRFYLGHALASLVDGPVFSLTLANQHHPSYHFDCGTEENALDWIHHCNHWAARESKIPPNLEISCDLHVAFSPPPPPAGASLYDTLHQHAAIKDHLVWLCSVYDQHLDIHSSLPEDDLIHNNWLIKKDYLAHEIKKYTAYEHSLESTSSQYSLSTNGKCASTTSSQTTNEIIQLSNAGKRDPRLRT